MNPQGRIVTVSYGTFSCRLEGFDDPVAILRDIAQIFDAAADGRSGLPAPADAHALLRVVPSGTDLETDGARIVLRHRADPGDDGMPAATDDAPAESDVDPDAPPPAPGARPRAEAAPGARPPAGTAGASDAGDAGDAGEADPASRGPAGSAPPPPMDLQGAEITRDASLPAARAALHADEIIFALRTPRGLSQRPATAVPDSQPHAPRPAAPRPRLVLTRSDRIDERTPDGQRGGAATDTAPAYHAAEDAAADALAAAIAARFGAADAPIGRSDLLACGTGDMAGHRRMAPDAALRALGRLLVDGRLLRIGKDSFALPAAARQRDGAGAPAPDGASQSSRGASGSA